MISNIPSDKEKLESPLKAFIFFRKDGYYPLGIPELTLIDHVHANPGTIRVEDALTGKIVWEETKKNKKQ